MNNREHVILVPRTNSCGTKAHEMSVAVKHVGPYFAGLNKACCLHLHTTRVKRTCLPNILNIIGSTK